MSLPSLIYISSPSLLSWIFLVHILLYVNESLTQMWCCGCPHPSVVLIHQLSSSISCPHPSVALIHQLSSSISCPHPSVALIHQLPSSISCPHPSVALIHQLPSSISCPHPSVVLIHQLLSSISCQLHLTCVCSKAWRLLQQCSRAVASSCSLWSH
ncbi:hypothetical protein BsWGS_17462 [Bradybaena similaris]